MKTKVNRIILILIGSLYLFSGLTKAIDSQWFAALVGSYGFPLLGNLSPLLSGIEIVLGLCLILDIKSKVNTLIVGILTLFFTITFAYGFFAKGVVDCGCMGSFITIPAPLSFARNILIILGSYWVWSSSTNSMTSVSKWKLGIVYTLGALSFCLAGSTLGMRLIDKSKVKLGDKITNTYLREYETKLSSGRSYVFIFSAGCGHCWNATENVKSFKELISTANVIGITLPNEDLSAYTAEMKPNFDIYKYATNELPNIFEIPTLLVLDNGIITHIYKSDKIPCAQILRVSEARSHMH